MAFPKTLDNCKDGFDLVCNFWMPRDSIHQRGSKLTNMLLTNASQGYIMLTDGNIADYDRIRSDINDLQRIYNIKEIGVDAWNAAHIINDLTSDGFEMTEFRQGFASLSGPSKEFERLVLGEKINHFGNPMLRWMASNVTVMRDAADNIKPIKEDRSNKIDGIIAAIMAIACAMQAIDEKSVWDY
jgi:phage terminase large subunit-like protein